MDKLSMIYLGWAIMEKSAGFLEGRIIFLVFLKLPLLRIVLHTVANYHQTGFLASCYVYGYCRWHPGHIERKRKTTLTESREDTNFALPFCTYKNSTMNRVWEETLKIVKSLKYEYCHVRNCEAYFYDMTLSHFRGILILCQLFSWASAYLII